MIAMDEFRRRMEMVSQMRALGIRLNAAALRAYRAGEIPYKPGYDIRSDYEYWRKLAEEKGIKIDAGPKGEGG